MRDQINGQLYDAWRTDCDTKQRCGYGVCRGLCDECQNDDYTHSIIPASEDAAFRNYEDRLAD